MKVYDIEDRVCRREQYLPSFVRNKWRATRNGPVPATHPQNGTRVAR
jgi:hypothetical protein